MDINLTGQVTATLVQNPITIIGAGIIGGLVTGSLTLLGIRMTQNHDLERDEKNRKEEARKTRREERKKAYTQFFEIIAMMDVIAVDPDTTSITVEQMLRKIANNSAELTLLSPEIANRIGEIYDKIPNLGKSFPESWKEITPEFKAVFPLMQDELNNWSKE